MKFILNLIFLIYVVNNNLYSQNIIITDQSKSQVLCKSSDLDLWVDVNKLDINYQWFFNDNVIKGENSRFLKIKNFDYSKTGSYYCVIKDKFSLYEEKSQIIQVYIATETIFLKKPENIMFQQDGFAKFETKVHANQDISKIVSIQWFYYDGEDPNQARKLVKLSDNQKYSGTKSEILTINNTNRFDKGIYFCVAEGTCGNDTTFAYLGDNIYFKLRNLSKGYNDCVGGDAILEVEVTNYIGGELEYQWYNPGFKLINESNRFIGTKTKKLTIKNVKMTDNNAYYLKVTHKESGQFLRSEHFYVEPDMAPIIRSQPKDYLILDKEAPPTQYGQTYVAVSVDNPKPCTFKWYRNDTLVRTTHGISLSDYFLGDNFSPRPARKSDVGVYQCEVINECGTTWSKKARVIWGLEPADFCVNTDAILVSDSISKDTNLFTYFWFYNDKLITDNEKFQNSSSNKLTIKNIQKNDGGNYNVYLQAINGGLTYYLGKVYLTVNIKPEITKQLPDTMYLSGKYIKKAALVVRVTSPILSYQYFNDKNEAITNIVNKTITNIYDEYQILYHGGPDLSLEDGTYYIKFWNNCGETRTNNFTISRTPKP